MTLSANIVQPLWPAPANIVAGVTTRVAPSTTLQTVINAQADKAISEFNLASHVVDNKNHVQANHVAANRAALATYLENQNPTSGTLDWHWLQQVHGSQAIEFSSSAHVADAIYTSQPLQVCSVLTADCLPILLCSHDGHNVAALHAGWRGLVEGVVRETLLSMTRSKGKSSQYYAWLGPAIGSQRFEVGQDVVDAFNNSDQFSNIKPDALAQAFVRRNNSANKYLADIYQLGSIALRQCGVHHIYGGGFCTYNDSERFFSYRRDGQTGRMLSFIYRTS